MFNAVYVDRERQGDEDPLQPLIHALQSGDSLIIFSRRQRAATRRRSLQGRAVQPGASFPDVVLVPAWIANVQRVMPKGEVVPVPVLCSVTFGAPIRLEPGEERRAFLDRACSRHCAAGRLNVISFIRNLSADQQVTALFLLVFGVLTLATALLVAPAAARARDDRRRAAITSCTRGCCCAIRGS